jgi:uncharacterized DUF497 family protein
MQSSAADVDLIIFLRPFQIAWNSGNHAYNAHMSYLEFEWDQQKSICNAKKHGVSLEKAQTTFYDEQTIIPDIPDHRHEQDRFILPGTSHKLSVLIVCHCYR